MLKSQTGPPQVSKMLKYSESPLSQLPYLELFQSGGGASQGVFGGGQPRDIFRGGPVKKITLYQWLHQSGEFTSVKKVSRIWLWISDNRATGPLGLDCYDTKIIFRCCSYLTFERSRGWPFWFSVTLNFYSKTAMVHFPLHCISLQTTNQV